MYKNTFAQDFASCFHSDINGKSAEHLSAYTGSLYELNENTMHSYMTIYCGGTLTAVFPYTYACSGVPYFCMLYTESGAGSIHVGEKIFTLSKNTLLLLRDRQSYHIDLTMAPWTYSIFFIRGDLFSCYFELFSNECCYFHKVTEHSPIPQHIKSLSRNATGNSTFYKLCDARLITEIVTELYDEIRPKESEDKIPSYIQEMHRLLNTSYANPFFLDDFEAHFHVSKYRLCREFTRYYGEAPLTYLNHKRIEIAKELLISSDLKIYEVGIAVGIENTNHFINLFKKNTGVTPLYYKNHYA